MFGKGMSIIWYEQGNGRKIAKEGVTAFLTLKY
jgi:hypothetical protein